MAVAAIPAAIAVVSAAVDAYSQVKQGQAQSALAMQNAQIANQAAGGALQRGAYQAGQIQSRTSQLGAQQKVAYANSGIDPQSGTAANVQADTRAMGALDAATARNNAARDAWGYEVEGANYRGQAQVDTMRASYGAGGALLGGFGRAAGYVAPYVGGGNAMSGRMGGLY